MEDNVIHVDSTNENVSQPSPANKKKKIIMATIISVSVLLVLILIAVAVLVPVISTGRKVITADADTPSEELENWMSMISDDVLITEIAIPGSHDSGAYDLMGPLATTQDLSFAEQLKRGVRYFDIRVDGEELVIFHGPVDGVPYEEVLEDIVDFITTHPTEFLILDFQHLKNDAELVIFDILMEKLGDNWYDYVVFNNTYFYDTDFIEGLTLGEVRGKCFIYVNPEGTEFRGPFTFERGTDREDYPNISLISPYTTAGNTSGVKRFVNKILPGYIEEFIEDFESRGFFVLQAQLTDGYGICGPRYREGRGIEAINEFVYNLYDSEYLSVINIILRDFVTCEKSAITLRLNIAKGLVNEDYKETFANMIAEYI